MSTQQDVNAIRAQRIANTDDPLAFMANIQTPFHLDQSSFITYLQHPQPNSIFVLQPSLNTNYMPQPVHNLEDSSDPTTAMNKALAVMAKAFKFNTIPTNNNQRSSLIPRNSQTAQPDINTSQDIKMQMVDDNVGNQQASTAETLSNNAPVYDSDGSTEVSKDENCYDHDIFNMLTQEVQYTNLQTKLDRTKQKLETFIIKKEKEYATVWNNWYKKCEECKYDKISYDKAYKDMQTKNKRLQAQLGDLEGKNYDTQCASNTLDPLSQKLKDENVSLESQVLNYAKENAHLKTTYKNLLDSIKVTQAQTNSIIDSLQK
nr:hypothetical protein [Tanacetum cinerariifolium]